MLYVVLDSAHAWVLVGGWRRCVEGLVWMRPRAVLVRHSERQMGLVSNLYRCPIRHELQHQQQWQPSSTITIRSHHLRPIRRGHCDNE